jgi:flagellar hook-basal body complex protein FliE
MANDMSTSIGAAQLRIEGEVQTLSQSVPMASMDVTEEAGQSGGVNFSDALKQAIQNVDDQQRIASDKTEAVDRGDSDDLVGAMLSSQTASLSFSMLMQVRNKVANAMDELLKLSL